MGAHNTLDYLDMFEQNYSFFTKNEDFGQTGTGSKTQNVEELSLDLMFNNNFYQNINSFIKQNSKLRIHSKPNRN